MEETPTSTEAFTAAAIGLIEARDRGVKASVDVGVSSMVPVAVAVDITLCVPPPDMLIR
jgi:hypothetical protein